MTSRAHLALLFVFVTGFLVCTGAFAEEDTGVFSPELAALNEQLAFMGSGMEIETAEYVTAPGSSEMGRTLLARDVGNRQLTTHFVAFDARRTWSRPGNSAAWIVDVGDGATTSGLPAAETAGAIRRAMGTWDEVKCAHIPLVDLGNTDLDLGFVQFLLGFGGSPFIFADVTHGGWLSGEFFEALVPGGSNFILGVTFTFVFVGGDSNNDGKSDTAFREIYYNDAFSWSIGANIDVETVALHEAGHGLSQGHFGSIFLDNKGNLRLAPEAVMNAAYTGVRQDLKGIDISGHCSIWGPWPN